MDTGYFKIVCYDLDACVFHKICIKKKEESKKKKLVFLPCQVVNIALD